MKSEAAKVIGKSFFLCLFAVFFLTTCGTPTQVPTPEVINIYSTLAAQPWLANVYACAEAQAVIIRLSAPEEADLRLRLGEPENLSGPAFQIGSEELLVVTQPESPIQTLTLDQVRALFSNPLGGQTLEVWVYGSGEDLQQIFAREVLRGQPVSSLARLAVSPQDMSDQLSRGSAAVGILPRHSKPETLREVFSLPEIPVLAIPKTGPEGSLKVLIACLQ